MAVLRCLNIDWLEVYVLEPSGQPRSVDYFTERGYRVVHRSYGTRVFRDALTILDDYNQPMFEIRRDPYSVVGRNGGFFPPESTHVRVSNLYCYHSDPIGLLRQFLDVNDYTYVKIFRIDICNDFVTFDRGDDPARFIERYMSGKYSKVNQTNISSHGEDTWGGRHWNSLSWGRPKSMVSTKMYCKTLELKQVADKPYIRQSWFLAGLVDDPISLVKKQPDGSVITPDVWRVEFSLKSSAKKWIKLDKLNRKSDDIVLPHTLGMYDTKTKLLTAFASLAHHYFRFKHFEPDKRKDRCADKVLFDFSACDTFYHLDRLASHRADVRREERLFVLLGMLIGSSSSIDEKLTDSVRYLQSYLQSLILQKQDPSLLRVHAEALRVLVQERLGASYYRPYDDILSEVQEYWPDLFV